MNMLSKIKDVFSGEVYDILGKPQSEPQVSQTVYHTDKYWVSVSLPSAKTNQIKFVVSMGEIGTRSSESLAMGVGETKEEAYNKMLAEFGELRNKYK